MITKGVFTLFRILECKGNALAFKYLFILFLFYFENNQKLVLIKYQLSVLRILEA